MDVLRTLLAIAFVGLLVRLRYDADRFEAVESDPGPTAATWSGYGLRLAWVLVAIALTGAVGLLWPDGPSALGLSPGGGIGAIIVGLVVGGIAAAILVGGLWLAGGSSPLPVLRPSDIGWAAVNATTTALVDELAFRGAAMGLLLVAGADPGLAVVGQAIAYALATRLARAEGGMLPLLATLLFGLLAGWLALATGGLLAPIVAHLVVRATALAYAADLLPLDAHSG